MKLNMEQTVPLCMPTCSFIGMRHPKENKVRRKTLTTDNDVDKNEKTTNKEIVD